jgi:hypothetical protein
MPGIHNMLREQIQSVGLRAALKTTKPFLLKLDRVLESPSVKWLK